MRPEIIQKLSEIVGKDNLYTSLVDLYCYTYDAICSTKRIEIPVEQSARRSQSFMRK